MYMVILLVLEYRIILHELMPNMVVRSRRDYSKLHLITRVRGRITTFAVTQGTTHDSHVFQKMWEMSSNGF